MKACEGYGNGVDGSVTPYVLQDNAAGTTMTFRTANPNKRHRVHGLTIATDIAGTYTLRIGAVVLLELYLGATSGYGERFHPFYYDNEVNNEAVVLTKPSGAKCTATCWVSTV